MGVATKWLKKKIAWYAYQRSDILRANVIHFTAESEAESVAHLPLKDTVVVPNGLTVENLDPQLSRKPQVLFLSRIHPKKGIPLLLRRGRHLSGGWSLKIVGPGDSEYIEEIKILIHKLGIAESTQVLPPVDELQSVECIKSLCFRITHFQ